MRPLGKTFPALSAQERIAQSSRASFRDLPGHYVELWPGDALLMPSGWWHEVESISEADESAQDAASACCISVGFNWPTIADAIARFATWRPYVQDYPILTQGQVLSQYYGEAEARAMPGFDTPVF